MGLSMASAVACRITRSHGPGAVHHHCHSTAALPQLFCWRWCSCLLLLLSHCHAAKLYISYICLCGRILRCCHGSFLSSQASDQDHTPFNRPVVQPFTCCACLKALQTHSCVATWPGRAWWEWSPSATWSAEACQSASAWGRYGHLACPPHIPPFLQILLTLIFLLWFLWGTVLWMEGCSWQPSSP